MWIYQTVDGDVHTYFEYARDEITKLRVDGKSSHDAWTLERLFEKLAERVDALRGALVRYAAAPDSIRIAMRGAYLMTLALVQLLDRVASHDVRFDDASCAALSFLQEWLPYISLEDAALNLVLLDGVDPAEALAVMQREHAELEVRTFEDDCPLCVALAASRN